MIAYVLGNITQLEIIKSLIGVEVSNNTQTLSNIVLLNLDERDLERREEADVRVEERDGVGDLNDVAGDTADEYSVHCLGLVF